MSEKRKRDTVDRPEDHSRSKKKAKKGFQVGPDNLPDGTYKRKSKELVELVTEKRAHDR